MMSLNWLSHEGNKHQFIEYGASHIGVFIVLGLIILIIFLTRKKLRNWKYEKLLLRGIAFLGVVLELSYYVWEITIASPENIPLGEHIIVEIIPLHLCAISLYLSIYVLLTKNTRLLGFTYFTSLGAVASYLFPSYGSYGLDHFRFYHYFYVHGLIIITPIYFILVHRLRVSFKDYKNTVKYLSIISLFVFIFDNGIARLTSGRVTPNYMYLYEAEHGTPLEFMGPWPIYVILLVLLVIILFYIMYIPWFILSKFSANDNTVENLSTT